MESLIYCIGTFNQWYDQKDQWVQIHVITNKATTLKIERSMELEDLEDHIPLWVPCSFAEELAREMAINPKKAYSWLPILGSLPGHRGSLLMASRETPSPRNSTHPSNSTPIQRTNCDMCVMTCVCVLRVSSFHVGLERSQKAKMFQRSYNKWILFT